MPFRKKQLWEEPRSQWWSHDRINKRKIDSMSGRRMTSLSANSYAGDFPIDYGNARIHGLYGLHVLPTTGTRMR